MSRLSQKRAIRQQKMLETAMKIVERDGLEGLTIVKLAKALDAAVGALYRYFPGKHALLLAMERAALDEFKQMLESLLLQIDKRLAAEKRLEDHLLRAQVQLLFLMRAYISDAQRAPARHRLIFEFMSSYESILPSEYQEEGEEVVQSILHLVKETLLVLLGEEATQEELEQATLHVWATVHGLDHFRKRDRIQPEHLHALQLLAVAQRNMLRGWGIPNTQIEEAFSWFETHAPKLLKKPRKKRQTTSKSKKTVKSRKKPKRPKEPSIDKK